MLVWILNDQPHIETDSAIIDIFCQNQNVSLSVENRSATKVDFLVYTRHLNKVVIIIIIIIIIFIIIIIIIIIVVVVVIIIIIIPSQIMIYYLPIAVFVSCGI